MTNQLTMYQASVPVFIKMLNNLSAIIAKAEAHAEAKKIEPSVFINARLSPDMFAFARQVQIATDTAKGCVARLAGIEVPSYADTETTFSELQDRIRTTVNFLQSFKPEQIDGSEDNTITLKLRGNPVAFTGMNNLLGFALPNFFFHVTTAYAILRHHGADIGKPDFLGNLT
jgi:hypothetical protein